MDVVAHACKASTQEVKTRVLLRAEGQALLAYGSKRAREERGERGKKEGGLEGGRKS